MKLFTKRFLNVIQLLLVLSSVQVVFAEQHTGQNTKSTKQVLDLLQIPPADVRAKSIENLFTKIYEHCDISQNGFIEGYAESACQNKYQQQHAIKLCDLNEDELINVSMESICMMVFDIEVKIGTSNQQERKVQEMNSAMKKQEMEVLDLAKDIRSDQQLISNTNAESEKAKQNLSQNIAEVNALEQKIENFLDQISALQLAISQTRDRVVLLEESNNLLKVKVEDNNEFVSSLEADIVDSRQASKQIQSEIAIAQERINQLVQLINTTRNKASKDIQYVQSTLQQAYQMEANISQIRQQVLGLVEQTRQQIGATDQDPSD